jgi:hypothetical protein
MYKLQGHMHEIIGGSIPFLNSAAINKETADYNREKYVQQLFKITSQQSKTLKRCL